MMIEGNKKSSKSFFLVTFLVLVTAVAGYWYLNRSADTQSEIPVNTPSKKAQNKRPNDNVSSVISETSSATSDVETEEPKQQKTQANINKKTAKVTIDNKNTIEEEEGGDNELLHSNETISKEVEQLSFLLDTDSQDDLAIGKIKQNLLNLSKQDTAVLNDLISLYEANEDNQRIKDELMDILQTIKDPEVEQLGMKLARSGDPAQIITGLDLLSQLSIPNKETLELTAQIISQNKTNPEIILPAIHAMPVITVSENKRSEILQDLSDLSQHEDESVRSESLFAISKWAKNERQLSPVIQALESDSTDERISAMMAIQKSMVVSDSLKDTIMAKMTNNNELWEIRSLSADALERFDLSNTEYADYKNFRQEQAADM